MHMVWQRVWLMTCTGLEHLSTEGVKNTQEHTSGNNQIEGIMTQHPFTTIPLGSQILWKASEWTSGAPDSMPGSDQRTHGFSRRCPPMSLGTDANADGVITWHRWQPEDAESPTTYSQLLHSGEQSHSRNQGWGVWPSTQSCLGVTPERLTC